MNGPSEPATSGQPNSAEPARSRWRADGARLQEAARFAVWGDTPTSGRPEASDPDEGSPSSGLTDPWDDTKPQTHAAEHLSPAKR